MKVKEYIINKTASKTAKENNLQLADAVNGSKQKRLFDFSLLDDMPITEQEKEVIKTDAFSGISAGSKTSYYAKKFNNFCMCDGIAQYFCHRVFNANGKHLYNIFQLTQVEHYQKTRKQLYDNYDVCSIKTSEGYTEPITDIEIA